MPPHRDDLAAVAPHFLGHEAIVAEPNRAGKMPERESRREATPRSLRCQTRRLDSGPKAAKWAVRPIELPCGLCNGQYVGMRTLLALSFLCASITAVAFLALGGAG